MLQSVLCANPFCWVKGQQLVHEVDGLGRDTLPLFVIRTVMALLHILYYLFVVGAVEGRVAAEQNVEYHAYAP